jgi:hypothetical protein
MTIIGRSEAIDPLYATQRGAVTMTGDGDLKSQCDLRIGLGVATEADARLIAPDDQLAVHILARLTEPGSGLIWPKNGRCAPLKIYRCEPDDSTEVCRRANTLRPAPDALLTAAFGEDYETRWDRADYLFPAAAARTAVSVLAPPGTDREVFEQMVRANLSDIDKPVGPLPGDDDEGSAEFRRYRKYAKRCGANGFNVAAVVKLLESEGMTVARQTVHRWVAKDHEAGLVVKAGNFGRWKWAE